MNQNASFIDTWMERFLSLCLRHPRRVWGVFGVLLGFGVWVMPFDLGLPFKRPKIQVQAMPDIGPNQQVIFTTWKGHSPEIVEDQLTYPLTIALQGTPGVKTVRSYSYFGFSSIYVLFDEETDFYWARTQLLERLNVLEGLPKEVTPRLGTDATALGQVFWYTLEGTGFSLQELRTLQDFLVKPALQSVRGVSEVASIGGYVKEYQIDLIPTKMKHYNLTFDEVSRAVSHANLQVSAQSIDVNNVDLLIQGSALLKSTKDLEALPIKTTQGSAIRLEDVAHVKEGPALRRGVLDKNGIEAVGGVVTARYQENSSEVIERLKERLASLQSALPERTLSDGSVSRVQVMPFYDRSELVRDTLITLKQALTNEALITVIVILLMLVHFRISFVVSLMLPFGVLLTFAFMKVSNVPSHIMSLSGIVIAIGTMVDTAMIISENIFKHKRQNPKIQNLLHLARPERQQRSRQSPLDSAFNDASIVFTCVLHHRHRTKTLCSARRH